MCALGEECARQQASHNILKHGFDRKSQTVANMVAHTCKSQTLAITGRGSRSPRPGKKKI